MATIPESSDQSSPFSYNASQTALVLLDFQNFIIGLCEKDGTAALNNAIKLRQWAAEKEVMIIHSIVDINGEPHPTTKGRARIQGMLAGIRDNNTNPNPAEEPSTLAGRNDQNREHVVLKSPGVVSGLKSREAIDLLAKNGIKSLIVCGLSTSGAVLRTTVPATDDGFVVSVVRDACADTKEGVHDMLMDVILPSRAHIMSTEELIKDWEQNAKTGSQ